ncbi:MAG: NUDIX domain-containing protein [Bacteroidales bacterium]|nr:NUDIX domain-containing protein [Bacteroidales bacterium]MCB9013372.1 NUDIX domain-containing protein [Bacteroidales bacterium]
MYKVFFKDRTVFFRDDFPETFKNKSGLFYKYHSRDELEELISAFFQLEKINSLYLFHDNIEFLWKVFMSSFKVINASGGLIRNEAGDILLIFRNGTWDLPKGKAENGESSEETAIREVCEECGLEPPVIKSFLLKTYHCYKLNGKNILKATEWFDMRVPNGVKTVPQIKENITEILWVKPGDIKIFTSNTFPSIVEVLKTAGVA